MTACKRCHTELPEDETRTRCVGCRADAAAASARWRAKNPGRHDEYLRTWREENRGRQYGLKPGEYADRVQRQENCCMICGDPPSGKRDKLMVDHDHETDQVRDLLCHNCNSGLGLFLDDPERLEKAAGYLRAWKEKGCST